jgi:hypothetical protein
MGDEQSAAESQASEPVASEPSPAEIGWLGTEEVRSSIPPERLRFGKERTAPPPEPPPTKAAGE